MNGHVRNNTNDGPRRGICKVVTLTSMPVLDGFRKMDCLGSICEEKIK